MDYTDGNLTGVETALSNMNNSLNELTRDIDKFKTCYSQLLFVVTLHSKPKARNVSDNFTFYK